MRAETNLKEKTLIKYLSLDNCYGDMKGFIINTKLRERKDFFEVTIYKEERKNLVVSIGDIAILKLEGYEIIRPVGKDFHLSLPKNLLGGKKNGDTIELVIIKICKRGDCIERPNLMVKNNKIDIRYFIPNHTIFGYPIYVIDRGDGYSSVWYSIGGGANHINIKNLIDIEKIAELVGFYFGDGNTSYSVRSFRLNNCESSVLEYCLDILEEIGISRDIAKLQIIYSSDKELNEEIKNKCITFWSKSLKINKNKIVSVNKAKNARETLKYGSARVFIDNTILLEIFLHGLLKGILQRISQPKDDLDKKLLQGFLRGLLAAEGSVYLNKHNSICKIGIAYNPRSRELNLCKKLLKNLGINFGKTHGNELLIYAWPNFKKLYEIDAFKMHKARNEKFIMGFKNHRFSRY